MNRSFKIAIALLFALTSALSGCIIWPGWWDDGGHGHGHRGGGYEHDHRR
jgi:hypothetical protein